MSVILNFQGSAGTVTGSKFILEHGGARLLVDAGLYQGERAWRRLNWEHTIDRPEGIGDVVLTHAHLDHCGYLPALVRQGFHGPVWTSAGTAGLLPIVLRDSAHLLEEEAEYAQTAGYSKHRPPLPLYTVADVERVLDLVRSVPFGTPQATTAGATVTLLRAGHVLGSASVLVSVGGRSVLFSGDLGRPGHPLLQPRADPPPAHAVVLESTYGDRIHPHPPGMEEHEPLAAAIRRTIGRGGSVLIPAFAVDRTELVLLALARLTAQKRIPRVPIHVDSPMALAALEVYRRPDLASEMRPEPLEELLSMRDVHEARTADESRRLNTPGTPSIIVSASGMATGGRVVHHLESLLPHAKNTVVLSGYQAVGTRGRSLQDGAREVKVLGRYVRVRADVVVDDTFSVHADADELVSWLHRLPRPPEVIYLVHGEPEARQALAERVRELIDCAVVLPRLGERVVI